MSGLLEPSHAPATRPCAPRSCVCAWEEVQWGDRVGWGAERSGGERSGLEWRVVGVLAAGWGTLDLLQIPHRIRLVIGADASHVTRGV